MFKLNKGLQNDILIVYNSDKYILMLLTSEAKLFHRGFASPSGP